MQATQQKELYLNSVSNTSSQILCLAEAEVAGGGVEFVSHELAVRVAQVPYF